MKHYFTITIIGILLILIAVFVWYLPFFNDIFSEFSDFFKENLGINRLTAISIFVILSAFSAMLSPLSSIPLVPFAITAWGNFDTLKFLLLGWLLGGIATYTIGKYAAHPFLKKTSPYKKIEYYQKKFNPRSEFFLVLLFRLALPAEIPGYVLGSIKYPFWKYMLATFISESPTAALTVYASKAFLEKNELVFIISVIAGIIFFSLFIKIFREQIKKNVSQPK